GHAGEEFAAHDLGDEVELLGPVHHRPGELGQVGRLEGRGRLVGTAPARHELATIRGAAHRAAGARMVPRKLLVLLSMLMLMLMILRRLRAPRGLGSGCGEQARRHERAALEEMPSGRLAFHHTSPRMDTESGWEPTSRTGNCT